MKPLKTVFLLLSLLALTACKNDSFLSNSSVPSKDWSLIVFSPPYMQGWVEACSERAMNTLKKKLQEAGTGMVGGMFIR